MEEIDEDKRRKANERSGVGVVEVRGESLYEVR